jgi:hypothetical protein
MITGIRILRPTGPCLEAIDARPWGKRAIAPGETLTRIRGVNIPSVSLRLT